MQEQQETTETGGNTLPRDATNMPFPRSAPYRSSDPAEPATSASDKLGTSLNIENMLLEEFNYASVTAYQSMEDRARVSNLYYVLLGALASGLAAIYQFGGSSHVNSEPLSIALLVLIGVLSFTFFEKIIRLRLAYLESLKCMNTIKEFYIKQFQQQMPQIETAFRWRQKTIPKGERFGSVTFVMSYPIALVGSLCLGIAALVITAPNFIDSPASVFPWPAVISVVVFGISLLWYVQYYRRSLGK